MPTVNKVKKKAEVGRKDRKNNRNYSTSGIFYTEQASKLLPVHANVENSKI